MAIPFNTSPVYTQRQIFQVDDAISQLPAFSNVYRGIFDFIENGGLTALGYNGEDIARWRRAIRPGVIWIGGRPSETDFFKMMMGGTPKEIEASDLTIEYNSAIDFNIYAQNDAAGTSGTVSNCYYGDIVNGSYTGTYVQFQIATPGYADNGLKSNVNVGDQLYIYNDSKWVQVLRVDTSVPYAHQVYAAPFDQNYIPQIYGGYPILPSHSQMTQGYSDSSTIVVHSEWETTGYLKTIQPFQLQRSWETPIDLDMAYRDIIQFPIIFDTVTGALIDSWDFKAMADGRNDMIMTENLMFFTGEPMTNTVINGAAFVPNKYTGFDGLLPSIFFGGGNIKQYDNSYGFDLDVDYTQIILQNDALKLSTEYLLLCGKSFKMTMERRVQDAFKGNSGACTFETFKRGGAEMADITRYGVESWNWLGATLHIKEVSAWSDSRWIGNGYVKNMGIMLPGTGLTDSNGQSVNPVEYWVPRGKRESGQWNEIWRDHRILSDKAMKFSGDIYHMIQMSVNGVENMWAIMPQYL